MPWKHCPCHLEPYCRRLLEMDALLPLPCQPGALRLPGAGSAMTCDMPLRSLQARVLALLQEHGELNVVQLRAMTGRQRQTLDFSLRGLVAAGFVALVRLGPQKWGRPQNVYRALTTTPPAELRISRHYEYREAA